MALGILLFLICAGLIAAAIMFLDESLEGPVKQGNVTVVKTYLRQKHLSLRSISEQKRLIPRIEMLQVVDRKGNLSEMESGKRKFEIGQDLQASWRIGRLTKRPYDMRLI